MYMIIVRSNTHCKFLEDYIQSVAFMLYNIKIKSHLKIDSKALEEYYSALLLS